MLRVQENHYNLLPFHDVKGRLFQGRSKMYKVENVEGLEGWLKANKLPALNDKEEEETKGTTEAPMISFDQVQDCVR